MTTTTTAKIAAGERYPCDPCPHLPTARSVFALNFYKIQNALLLFVYPITIRTVALIPGKVNFTRMSRYGGRTAKTFAVNFGSHVDWLNVNGRLAHEAFQGTDYVAIAIAPSYITKSGRLTYGMGKFWSGVVQRVKRGLKIMSLGAISLSKHSCVMLGAVQTPSADLRKKADSSRD